ncbi:MAG: FtsB family cell division protein [Bacteroidia bacterium]|jgi:cell division protein FtsB
MKLKNLLIKFITNRYIVNKYTVTVLFLLVWISFFDRFDLYSQLDARKKLKQLEQEKNYYLQEIENNKATMNLLYEDSAQLIKFAREKYLMKKNGEDIFLMIDTAMVKKE